MEHTARTRFCLPWRTGSRGVELVDVLPRNRSNFQMAELRPDIPIDDAFKGDPRAHPVSALNVLIDVAILLFQPVAG